MSVCCRMRNLLELKYPLAATFLSLCIASIPVLIETHIFPLLNAKCSGQRLHSPSSKSAVSCLLKHCCTALLKDGVAVCVCVCVRAPAQLPEFVYAKAGVTMVLDYASLPVCHMTATLSSAGAGYCQGPFHDLQLLINQVQKPMFLWN